MWDKIILFLGGSSVLIVAIAWLTRSIIAHYLSKDIETYKAQLQAASAKELEHLKAELQIEAQRHQITFSKLHENRALIIAELYNKVNDLSAMAYAFGGAALLGAKRTKIERAGATYEACQSFYSYFQKHKIYFSKELCSLVIDFVSLISEPTSTLYQIQDDPELVKTFEKEFYDNFRELEKRLNGLKANIEQEFRSLLGAESIKGEQIRYADRVLEMPGVSFNKPKNTVQVPLWVGTFREHVGKSQSNKGANVFLRGNKQATTNQYETGENF